MLSWNVRGINSPIKRGKVYAHLKKIGAEIIFLQETHIKTTARFSIKAPWMSQVYQSSFSTKARGVAIIIKKSVPFIHKQTIHDINGRYLIVIGEINSLSITLVNIYGPNFDDPSFFEKVFKRIPDFMNTQIIMAGDYNCVLNARLDTQPRRTTTSKSSLLLNNYMQKLNLVDSWRAIHPTDHDFSFYSSVHKTYSRIDLFLIDSRLLQYVTSTKYHTRLISDHAPVSLILKINRSRGSRIWKFDNMLLKDVNFCEYLADRFVSFLENNDKGDVSDSILWEAMKAVIRGDIMSYQAAKNKQNKAKLIEIDTQVTKLEKEYRSTNCESTLKKIVSLRSEYNSILAKKVSKQLMQIKQKQFEIGDKPQKLLARQLKHSHASRAIYKIKSENGEALVDPKDINNSFSDFYKKVYKSKKDINQKAIDDFLSNIELPTLNSEAKQCLDEEITLEELNEVISQLPNNKSAGPDGFSAEFYKKFKNHLAPLMHRLIKNSKEQGKFPSTMYQANIVLIPKPGRDKLQMSSYRPISLIPNESKIISKIFANRLKKYIGSIVHQDQTGFMPGRHIHFNLRRLFNIMYSKKHTKACIIALDALRAFDQLEWEYMFAALTKFDFGTEFIKWIKIIYAYPVASVITNQDISNMFQLSRGTRQGCPLSPFLFAISMEPLAASIRQHLSITPIKTEGRHQHLSLYADDILLYISNPEKSIPPLFDLIDKFGSFSGFTINWEKSELMPISDDLDKEFLEKVKFKIANNSFKYLGIMITRKPNLLLQLNWKKKVDQLKSDISFWKTLPMSMVGRINVIKMVVLPRFLYVFQAIPFFIPLSYFKHLESIITQFIWANKTARINKKHLNKPKDLGGFGLPNFKYYYWAANLNTLAWWRKTYLVEQRDKPEWLAIEDASCNMTSLPALLNSPIKIDTTNIKGNIIISNSIKIWKQIKAHLKIPEMYLDSPICNNHAFPPGLNDLFFSKWKDKGILTIQDLYKGGTFSSFEQLKQNYNLTPSNFFRYLQIRDFVRKHIKDFETERLDPTLDTIVNLHPGSIGNVSNLYKLLLGKVDSNTDKIRQDWEDEMGISISDDRWDECLSNVHSCSVNARHHLIQYKVIHRLHYSKSKLHKIFPTISSCCNKCNVSTGTLFHSLWACSKLQPFWKNIFKFLSEVYSMNLEPDPSIGLLGVVDSSCSRNQTQAILFCMCIAKKIILQMWKTDAVPTFEVWARELGNMLHLEELRFILNDKLSIFKKIWEPFILFLQID